MSVEEHSDQELDLQEDEQVAEEQVAEGEEGEDGEKGAGEDGVASAITGLYNATDVNDEVFEELQLPPVVAEEVQQTWNMLLRTGESREAVGEAIYGALFDAAPSLQNLFKTPRAVMAMRFMNGLHQIISDLTDPKALKVTVETLGFQHLDLEVTPPRVGIFRDAILDLLTVELDDMLTPRARDGWCTFLNYVGGSYIYIRVKFSERLKILTWSWATANKKAVEDEDGEEGAEGAGEGEEGGASAEAEAEAAAAAAQAAKKKEASKSWFGGKSGVSATAQSFSKEGGDAEKRFQNTSAPTTFNDMFSFNCAVMGFANAGWMGEVLYSFDTIVCNVANSYRLQEECDVLALRMAKYKGNINLPDYKAVMLASLRSLCKEWGSQHEVAWSWLWENVERMISALLGRPARQERALTALYVSLDESSLMVIRREVYSKFFAIAPAGQDYFKQSTTRLHFIADKLVQMTLDMYKEPKRMVEDISALGLRHVGYGIPTDLFGPFVTACVQTLRMLTEDDKAQEAFRWSLSLISRILTRVITEGSTIVMKAINANSARQLRKAVSCAPRGKRALWMLNVQVGTQSISPLMWAIETGSLDAASAIIVDLLTIRADRDRYCYGMDILFERHEDIIRRLCLDAPALLPTFLEGLVWRSRIAENGERRVNYYVKHLVVDAEGVFSKATEWITESRDPKIVCHPVVAMVTDMVWSKVAFRTFLFGKAWFLFTIFIFILSQSIFTTLNNEDSLAPLPPTAGMASSVVEVGADGHGGHRMLSFSGATTYPPWGYASFIGTTTYMHRYEEPVRPHGVRVAILCCRIFIYVLSMGQWMFYHIRNTVKNCRAGDVARWGRCRLPQYLCNWQDLASLGLTLLLLLMLCLEPILYCLGGADADHSFTDLCDAGREVSFTYSLMSTGAMLLYFLMLSDLSVLSTRVSAFALVCGRVLSEVLLFLFGLTFFVVAFACAVCALEQENPEFKGVPASALRFYKMTFGMFSGVSYDSLSDNPALLVAVIVYVITTVIFLLNLLIAQLVCSYQATYQDMLGFARLNRGKIVTETMAAVPKTRWSRFVESLRLDERVEFGEGDMGLAGGIQVWEPASANITTTDMIRRFGGSTSAAAQWPEEENGADAEDRFEKLERLVEKAMKRMSGKKRGGGGSGIGSSTGFSGLSASQSDSGSAMGSGTD